MFDRDKFSFLLIIVLSFFACSRQASHRGSARIEDLKLPGDYADCLLADLDGDSITEIIALAINDTGSGSNLARRGTLFSFAGGGYSSNPTMEFDIPSDAILFDTGDVDGDSLPEIIYMAATGVFAMDYNGGAVSGPRQVLLQNSIFTLPTSRTISSWDFYREIDRGRAFLLMPCIRGITIYHFRQGGFDSLSTIRFPQEARAIAGPISEMRATNQLTYTYRLPGIHFGDYDADGLTDIFVTIDNHVLIYSGSIEGRFDEEPSVVFGDDYGRAILDDNPNGGVIYQIADINGDGRDDIVVSRNSGGVTNFRTEIGVHICRPRGGYEKAPSYSRNIEKSAGLAYINDFNGDRRLDLAIPALELGVVPVIKMLVLNSLNVDIDIFLQQGGANFPDEPSLTKSISSAVDLNSGNIEYGETLAFGGDFDGDGRCDFLTDAGRGLLTIYFADPEHVLTANPGWSIRIPPPHSVYAYDLNHDSRDEILAFYGPASPDNNVIRVIWVAGAK